MSPGRRGAGGRAPGRRAPGGRAPGRAVESSLWEAGYELVVGIDEVGKGSWAGPLTVAAVAIPMDRRINGVRDSKQLSPTRREQLFARIGAWCTHVGVGHASPEECDGMGMSDAQRLATRRALEQLGACPDAVIMDGRWDFVKGLVGPEVVRRTIVKGDSTSLSIAAASVIAKVTRDALMRAESESFPPFAFDENKGYPCPRHVAALHGYGPTSIHRRSWVFMERIAWRGAQRLDPVGAQPRLF